MKAKNLLNLLSENNLTSNKSIFSTSTSTGNDLDFVLEMVEKDDLGVSCLKSTYQDEMMEDFIQVIESLEDEQIDEFVSTIFDTANLESMDEAGFKYKPYHDKIGNVHTNYKTIMKGRKAGGNANRSILQLGADEKFYNMPIKYYSDLHKKYMASSTPKQNYKRLIRALVNLEINFKNEKPEYSKKARAILNSVKNLIKPDKYFKSTK